MFKNNHLAGVLNFRGSSVPSIGGTPSLASALAAVERAETQLEAARSAAKAAAKREGKGIRNLFSDGAFVARSSAERWCDEAREAGIKVGWDLVVRGLTMSEDPPFEHLAKRLKREGAMRPDAMRRCWDKLDAAGFLDATRAGDYEKAAQICVEVQREEAGKATGERILAAGKRARMGGPEVPLPAADSFAAKVIAAGKKRRNEV